MKDETQLLSEIAQAAETLGLLINELQTLKRPGTTSTSEVPRDENKETSGSWTIPRLKDQCSPEQAKAGLKQFPLLRGLTSYGMLNIQGNETSICPERPVKAATALVEGFLCHKILDAMKHKHGIEYELETTLTGDLIAILVRGDLTDLQVKELVSGSRWAFEKSLQENQPK